MAYLHRAHRRDESGPDDQGLGALPVILGVLGGLVLVLYGVGVALSSGSVPSGTTVLGVDIGGMDAADAKATLAKERDATVAKPFKLTVNADTTVKVKPADAGLAVDWGATVDSISGTEFNPIALVSRYFSSREVEPAKKVDEEKLAKEVDDLATQLDFEAAEPTIVFPSGVAKVKPGEAGLRIRRAETAAAMKAEWLTGPSVTADVEELAPSVTDEAAQKVLDTSVKVALSAPVVVTVGTDKVTIPAEAIAKALTFTAADGTLTAGVDGEHLHKVLKEEFSKLEKPGEDASFRIEDGKPVLIPARTGTEIDPAELGTGVASAMAKAEPAQRTLVATLRVKQPDLSTEEAKGLGIVEKIGGYRQLFPTSSYRRTNVNQAAQYMDGKILKPGEVYSMNDTIKERTPENGYVEGIYIEGGRFRMGQGGGVSIITTATWSAAFYSGLEAVEVNPHGLYISRYQPGLEATVAWGYLDLKFRNDTGHGVLITARTGEGYVEITMYGTKKWDEVKSVFGPRRDKVPWTTIEDSGEGCVPMQGDEGFAIDVTRQFIKDGKVADSEVFTTRYRPTNQVVCANPAGSR